MQELTDDQLDGLFRKSAEEFEPEFDAAAWQAMQQQLNDRDKTLFWGKLLRWGIPALILLLTTGVSLYVYKNRSPKPVATVTLKGGSPTDERTVTTRDSRLPARSIKPSHEQPLPVEAKSVQAKVLPANIADKPAPLTEDLLRIENVKPTTTNQGSIAVARRPSVATGTATRTSSTFVAPTNRLTRSASTRSPKSPYRQVATTRQATVMRSSKQTRVTAAGYSIPFTLQSDDGSTNPDQPMQETALPVTLLGLDTLANKPATWPEANALLQHEVTQPAIDILKPATPPVKQTELSIRLLVSPDLSSVGLKDFQRPGTNFGALLEYQFATRWRIQAGVLRSVKIYESPASRYEWGSYTWPVQPESVYGRCNMLDIPLNLRYDFVLRTRPDGRQNRWFVSGGFTTYVMLREDYTYNYTNPDDPRINARARDWSTSTGGYGFSHLNVAAGYERAFGKRLSWQIEPFVKVPLKGVGYYKLNLLSTGAFFSLRYKLR